MTSWLIHNINIPYRWGGSNPSTGFDCSGIAQEFLVSFGAHPDNGKTDFTAQGLYNYFSKNQMAKENIYEIGALAFFGSAKTNINHVAIILNDRLMFEAGGGGSRTLTVDDAIKQNAFTRVRPITNRKDLQAVLMPVNILKYL
jgi:cell wall-associated NlpC family hydrolase